MQSTGILRGFALIAAVIAPATFAFAQDDAAARCAALNGTSIAVSTISLPTRGGRIMASELTAASDPNGEFCKVRGAIFPIDRTAPDLNFEINLPSNWNGKALHLGGGGYDGSIVTGLNARFLPPGTVQPLKQGYVTFGSDSGHVGEGSDASFALNDEALENFGGDQLKKTRDVAIWLVTSYYARAPSRLYFEGSSQGGHEAFLVMQRWPEDYDGIVAIHPVYDITALQLSGVRLGQALYNTPGAWLSPEKAKLVYDSVMLSCDKLDGLADDVISNVAGCRETFELKSLRCDGGKDTGADCLSDPQLRAVRVFDSETKLGVTLEGGIKTFAHWPIIEGGSTAGTFNLGRVPQPQSPPASGDAFAYIMGDQLVRFMALRDPGFDSLQLDPKKHAARLQEVSKIADASSVELEPFRDRGGKLLLLHGTADMAVTPHNTIDYYERLVERFGSEPLKSFMRFYIVPGFGHGDGPFVAGWDWLGALDAWVEDGRAPNRLVVVDTADPGKGRSRPLCEYPLWPKYRGSGDPTSAAGFDCVAE